MPAHQVGKTPILDDSPFRRLPAWVVIFSASLDMPHQAGGITNRQ